MMNASKAKPFEFSAASPQSDRGGKGKSLLAGVALIVFGLLAAACSEIHTKTPNGEPVLMNQEEFSAYVERVFRHHNNVVNELLFVSPSDVAGGDPVANAELQMNHACQPLNDIASVSAAGLSPDFWTKMKLAKAVPECEAATLSVEKLFSQATK